MSARQKKVREVAELIRNMGYPDTANAALAEVEEWEARLATAEAQRDMALETLSEYRQQFNQWSEYEGPSKLAAAEAERDAYIAEKNAWVTEGFLGPDELRICHQIASEADRLKAALTEAEKWLKVGDVPSHVERKRCMGNALAAARAALVPADRNTTEARDV